jgi:glycosyltransferase involved in cell wall biosynthesis
LLGEYNRKKIGRIISWCDFVIAGNEHLASFARAYNAKVYVIPSAIDTQRYVPEAQRSRSVPVLVWVGTPSSISYLKMLEPSLKALLSSQNFVFRIIGGISDFSPDIPVENIPWDLANEIKTLQTADIGVMPLKDGEKERGKCGYKLLQYMACGLPVVASPVGVNRDIVRENHNGFFAFSDEEWKIKLEMLFKDSSLRMSLGQQARLDVESRYSLHQMLPKFVNILQKAVP